jgi:YHS domain-containing protein
VLDDGDPAAAAALETEGELEFRSDAPALDAPPAVAGLAPVNTVCPVSGEPANAKYSILFEGRVIAFCCLNCPKEFWADPETYRAKLP